MERIFLLPYTRKQSLLLHDAGLLSDQVQERHGFRIGQGAVYPKPVKGTNILVHLFSVDLAFTLVQL